MLKVVSVYQPDLGSQLPHIRARRARHELYDTKVVVLQHQFFGPFPISYKQIADEDTQKVILGIMSTVPPEEMKPFQRVGAREICNEDKTFSLKIMKLDPRD